MAERKNRVSRALTFTMPRFEINIPMPAGAAIPARSPQSQTVPPQDPAQPSAAQSR